MTVGCPALHCCDCSSKAALLGLQTFFWGCSESIRMTFAPRLEPNIRKPLQPAPAVLWLSAGIHTATGQRWPRQHKAFTRKHKNTVTCRKTGETFSPLSSHMSWYVSGTHSLGLILAVYSSSTAGGQHVHPHCQTWGWASLSNWHLILVMRYSTHPEEATRVCLPHSVCQWT